MKFCEKCGAQLSDEAVFCNACGHRVGSSGDNPSKPIKEGEVYKCPYCGEILPSDVTHCPTCKHEIRGRKVTSLVRDFYEKYTKEASDIGKCELVKMFPIPNNKEDIREFLLIGSTNFDAYHYVSKKKEENLDSAWLAKIEECYKKAQIMLQPEDLIPVTNIYTEIKNKVEKLEKRKKIGLIVGLALILLGSVGALLSSVLFPTSDPSGNLGTGGVIMSISLVVLALGIVILVLSVEGKKTMKEMEELKKKKEEKRYKK